MRREGERVKLGITVYRERVKDFDEIVWVIPQRPARSVNLTANPEN